MAAAEGYVFVPNSNGGQGVPTIQSFTLDRSQRVSDAHAHFHNAVLNGNVYIGANPQATPVTTQAGLSATTPMLTLWNPVGSGINMIVWTHTLQITTAPAAIVNFSLATNVLGAAAPSSTTAANVINAYTGNAAGNKGQCYRVATLAAAPVAYRYTFGVTAASLVAVEVLIDNIDGAIILSPGIALSVQATAAAAGVATFTWEEAPLLT